MEKIINTISLQNVLPRPLGYIRYGVFLLSFLIARIPFWFIIFAMYLYNGIFSLYQDIYIIISIFICRTFKGSEFAGGKNSFLFFSITRILRGVFLVFLSIFVFSAIFYIIMPYDDTIGKIAILLLLIISPFLLKNNNRNTYYNGYYLPTYINVSVNFLWFYIGFIPDSLIMNIAIFLLIYALEFYNLIYNRPLGLMPNQNSLK